MICILKNFLLKKNCIKVSIICNPFMNIRLNKRLSINVIEPGFSARKQSPAASRSANKSAGEIIIKNASTIINKTNAI